MAGWYRLGVDGVVSTRKSGIREEGARHLVVGVFLVCQAGKDIIWEDGCYLIDAMSRH